MHTLPPGGITSAPALPERSETSATQPKASLALEPPVQSAGSSVQLHLSRDTATAPLDAMPFDAERVARLRQALQDGRLQPDASRIAAALLHESQALLSTRSAQQKDS